MKFGEATKYGFKNIFVFEGRGRRSEFWWFYLALQLISFPIMMILLVVMTVPFISTLASIDPYDPYAQPDSGAFVTSFGIFGVTYLLMILFGLAMSVILLGATARRLHDMGQSAQWLWLYLLGLGIVITVMCIMDSQPFANKYGPDPKAHERGFSGAVSYSAPPAYSVPPAATLPPPPPPGATPTPPSDPYVR